MIMANTLFQKQKKKKKKNKQNQQTNKQTKTKKTDTGLGSHPMWKQETKQILY